MSGANINMIDGSVISSSLPGVTRYLNRDGSLFGWSNTHRYYSGSYWSGVSFKGFDPSDKSFVSYDYIPIVSASAASPSKLLRLTQSDNSVIIYDYADDTLSTLCL